MSFLLHTKRCNLVPSNLIKSSKLNLTREKRGSTREREREKKMHHHHHHREERCWGDEQRMKKTSSLLERDEDDCVRSLGSLCRQKLASFQDKLSCPICKEFFTLPVTLVRCGHTFCGKCLNDYVRTFQDDKKRKCPRCKGPVTHESDWDNTGEVAVKPNELVEEIVESWKKVLKENTTSGGGG